MTPMAGAQERNRRLLEQLSKDEFKVLLDQIDRLTDTAAQMLADEGSGLKLRPGRLVLRSPGEAGTQHFSGSADAPRAGRDVKMACLAPSVALR